MYKSKYNYFFLREDLTWGVFNTLSGSLTVLENCEKKAYDNLPNSDIREITPFVNQLNKLGILHNEEYDEEAVVNVSRYRRMFADKAAYLRILTTTECNARCSYCYENDYKKYSMTLETADQVIKYILDMPFLEKFYIHWFGGEPLANIKVIDRIMDAIYDKLNNKGTKVFVYFTSNGSLITKEIVYKSKNCWHVTWYQITIDALGDEYDLIKNYKNKKYNFNLVINNIGQLLTEGIQVLLRINFLPDETERVKSVVNFLIEKFKGFYSQGLIKFFPAPIFNSSSIPNEKVEVLPSHICNLYETNTFIKNLGLLRDYEPFDLSFIRGQCYACHHKSFVIDPKGKLFKCILAINNANASVGTVMDGFKANREYFKWVNPNLPQKCNQCVLLPICQGGCRAGAFGYMDHCCNYIFQELDKILEYKLQP